MVESTGDLFSTLLGTLAETGQTALQKPEDNRIREWCLTAIQSI